jgi:hypothetical protein
MGSAPNAAAASDVKHPVNQGLVQMLGVFVDTFIVCTSTAIIILVSGVYQDAGFVGVELTQRALETQVGHWGADFLAVLLFLFCYSAVLGNYAYAESNVQFINNNPKVMFIFRIFVTTPFDIILLLFANDFVTMSIATDSVRYSQKPEKWNVNSLVGSSIGLAIFIVIESFAVLIVGFHLGLNSSEIDTFIFDMLVFSGQFTVYMVRERGRFWNSRPGKWLLIASAADIFFITIISSFGILVTRIPFYDVLIVLGLTFLFMVLIDTVKNYIFRHYGI